MKPEYKKYIRLNLGSLLFIVVSLMSVTLAWFAYSGLSEVVTEVDVKAWYIEIKQDGKKVSQDITISFPNILPGMEEQEETLNIENLGDSDAQIKYSLVSIRILDRQEDYYLVDGETITSEYVEDILSHEYPFKINISLDKGYALANGGKSTFRITASWPLDSNNDELDSWWGNAAYLFQETEKTKKINDPQYQMKPAIQIVIGVVAEQYLAEATSSDYKYNLGDEILFDVVSKVKCSVINTTCLKTYVIDADNKIGDTLVKLMPDTNITYGTSDYNNYNNTLATLTSTWNVSSRALVVDDILGMISADISNSYFVRNGLSDTIIGKLNYQTRMTTEITKAKTDSGYYRFVNNKFGFMNNINCFWTNSDYSINDAFAVVRVDSNFAKLYNHPKTNNCNVIPIIEASKINL